MKIWKWWFLRGGENWSTWRITSRSKGEHQQQTQPTCGVGTRIWTWATMVGGDQVLSPLHHPCSSICVIALGKVLNDVWKWQISDSCDPTSHGIRAFWGNMWRGSANFYKLCSLWKILQFMPIKHSVLKISPVSLKLKWYREEVWRHITMVVEFLDHNIRELNQRQRQRQQETVKK